MSEDRDLDSVVTVSADGISVEKRFERDDFAVPAVEFTIRSDRKNPTAVRLVDYVPEEFPMDSVGFHPEYHNDDWTAFKDHRVEFERDLLPGEEIVTVYGVRLSETDDIADFLGEPELADLSSETEETPPDPLASITGGTDRPMDGNTITDIVSEEGNQVVRDVLTGERDSLPGLGDDAGDASEPGPQEPAGAEAADPARPEPSASIDDGGDPLGNLGAASDVDDVADEPKIAADPLADPTSGSTETTEPTDAAESPVSEEPTVEPADVEIDSTLEDDSDETSEIVTAEPDFPATGNLAGALAEEIRDGSVSDADLAVLRQELDVTLPESTNVRIRHLQSRVEDLAAYTEALEGFIDENGTATRVLEEFEAFEDEVAQLDDEIDGLEAEIDDVQGFADERQAIDELEDSVGALQSNRSDTDERLDTLEAETASISEHLEENDEKLQSARSDLDDVGELETEIESIQAEIDTVSELDERITALENLEDRLDAVEGLEGRVDSLEGFEDRLEFIEDVDDRLDAIEGLRTDVAAVQTEFGELEELVGANTEDLTAIGGTLSNVEAELAGVTDVEGDLQSIDERLESLVENLETTEQFVESSVSTLQTEVETITDDVEEIRAWRDQLKGVFGSGDG